MSAQLLGSDGEGRWCRRDRGRQVGDLYRRGHRRARAQGDVLCTAGSEEEVLRYVGRFMQYYREHAKYKERTYTFIERVGLERIRAVVADDADGIAAELDAEMEQSIAAVSEPWKEAAAPKTPNQFASLLSVDG